MPACCPAGELLAHATGVRVALHTRSIAAPVPAPSVEAMSARARTATILGRPVRVPDDEDMLLHVCGHAAFTTSRANGRWLCDAALLLRRRTQLDWDRCVGARAAGDPGLDGLGRGSHAPLPPGSAAWLAVQARRRSSARFTTRA